MIKMKYPNIDNNSLCDGRVHEITPYNISRIEDLEIYLMSYFDETMNCEAITILSKLPNGDINKLPLLDYDLLYDMINSGKIRLTEEDLFTFFAKYISNPKDPINFKKPFKDFNQCLTAVRAAIILYIGIDGCIYYKSENKYIKIDGNTLSKIMQLYDIEWHRTAPDSLASKSEIEYAINNTMGHMLKKDPYDDGLSCEERYSIGNIHHYTIGYQYKDLNGLTRYNSSV